MGNKNSISFIFPVYNEENRLKFLFKNIIDYEKITSMSTFL